MFCVAEELQQFSLQIAGIELADLDAGQVSSTVSAARHLERSVASLLVSLGRRANELADHGHGPAAREALLGAGEVSARRARRDAARAATADLFPLMAQALSEGKVGGEHLDAVSRVLPKLSEEERRRLVAHDAVIAEAAARLPVDTFNHFVRDEVDRLRDDDGRTREEQQQADSEFRHWAGRDGMGHFRGKLDAERYESIVAAIEREMRSLATSVPEGEPEVHLNANLAAAALVELICGTSSGRGRVNLNLIVDADTAMYGPHDSSVHETSSGRPLSPDAVDRLACDAVIRRVVVDDKGVVINVGRRYRTAIDAQWAALRSLYTTCAWAGCDRSIDRCQAHHITTWEDDGHTDLENLLPLCTHHHHSVHEGRWRVELSADRTASLFQPDGTLWASARPDRLARWTAGRSNRHRARDEDAPDVSTAGPAPNRSRSRQC